jgi:hypothetical protein
LPAHQDSIAAPADIVEITLRMSKLGLIDLYEQSRLEGVNLLVVVDQFEELFRYRKLSISSPWTEYGVGEDAIAFVNLLLEVGGSQLARSTLS